MRRVVVAIEHWRFFSTNGHRCQLSVKFPLGGRGSRRAEKSGQFSVVSGQPKCASSPECVGDFWGRQLPKCMQQCDFRHVERLKSIGFFHRQFRLAIHAFHTAG